MSVLLFHYHMLGLVGTAIAAILIPFETANRHFLIHVHFRWLLLLTKLLRSLLLHKPLFDLLLRSRL